MIDQLWTELRESDNNSVERLSFRYSATEAVCMYWLTVLGFTETVVLYILSALP